MKDDSEGFTPKFVIKGMPKAVEDTVERAIGFEPVVHDGGRPPGQVPKPRGWVPEERELRKAMGLRLKRYNGQTKWVGNKVEVRCIGRYCMQAPGIMSSSQLGKGEERDQKIKTMLRSGEWVVGWLDTIMADSEGMGQEVRVYHLRPKGSLDAGMVTNGGGVCGFFREGECHCPADDLPSECEKSKRAGYPDYFSDGMKVKLWLNQSKALYRLARSAMGNRVVIPVEFAPRTFYGHLPL